MKTTTTEKFLTTCPSCGAAIGPNDKFCSYCGTRVVYERTVTEEDSFSMDMNKVDIESQAPETGGGSASIVGIAFMIFWCMIALFMTVTFFSVGGFMGIVPLGMCGFGVAMLVKMIKDFSNYRSVAATGERYSATVLDHCVYQETRGSGEDRHMVTLAKVKVLADIDGMQKVIMIKVGDPSNAAKYPEGSTITIAGSGNYYVIVK